VEGKTPPELKLDVLEAAARRSDAAVAAKLKAYRGAQAKDDDLAGFREVLAGGDATNGRRIFFGRAETQCFRCHKIGGEGGGEVGPNLAGLGTRATREYILNSMIHPSKEFATGYEYGNVNLRDGGSVAGVIKGETSQDLTILSFETNALVKVRKTDIAARSKGVSGMPEGLEQMLSLPDRRDLTEFLATLK
jgi:quinoprotein glucose dehydrogenase